MLKRFLELSDAGMVEHLETEMANLPPEKDRLLELYEARRDIRILAIFLHDIMES